jgi:uncharacterized membrane protein
MAKAKEVYQKESHLRSVLKGLTWRVVATTTIILIAYFSIGDISVALEIGFIEFFVKLLLYYLHERAWQIVPRGTIRKQVQLNTPNEVTESTAKIKNLVKD